jgi:hypothetical protein
VVGFPIVLRQRLDRLVLQRNLAPQKLILAFEALDIGYRNWSRLVSATCEVPSCSLCRERDQRRAPTALNNLTAASAAAPAIFKRLPLRNAAE